MKLSLVSTIWKYAKTFKPRPVREVVLVREFWGLYFETNIWTAQVLFLQAKN